VHPVTIGSFVVRFEFLSLSCFKEYISNRFQLTFRGSHCHAGAPFAVACFWIFVLKKTDVAIGRFAAGTILAGVLPFDPLLSSEKMQLTI
jgi:hypothetical protein